MPGAADVPRVHATLRETFASGRTKTLAWRRRQLTAFLRMLKEGVPAMSAALNTDLHKSAWESMFAEIGAVIHECKLALKHVEAWMRPETVASGRPNEGAVCQIYSDPLGVCLVIGAWNYPIHLTLCPLVGAIAAGNCCVIKVPSQKYSAAASRAMAQLVAKYLDSAAIQVIEGDRHATQAVLQPAWDLIFFTGGAYVGKMVASAAAKHLTPTILELGGKSPTIVGPGADAAVAARRVAWGSYTNSGQTCIRPDYCLVHESVGDAFVEEMRKAVLRFYGADPQKTEAFGRIINERAHDRLSAVLRRDERYVAFGGEMDRNDKYVAPTLLDFGEDFEAFRASAAMEDEIFGPIFPVYRYRDLDEVTRFINAGEKPLAMYIFSDDDALVETVLQSTSCGGVCVNETIMHLSNANLPFGGVGRSGMGSYHGHFSFKSFSHSKSVMKKTFDGVWDEGRYAAMEKMTRAVASRW